MLQVRQHACHTHIALYTACSTSQFPYHCLARDSIRTPAGSSVYPAQTAAPPDAGWCAHLQADIAAGASSWLQNRPAQSMQPLTCHNAPYMLACQYIAASPPEGRAGMKRDTHLQQLTAHVEQHGGADAQQAVGAPCRVAEQRVPQPHRIRERKLLHQDMTLSLPSGMHDGKAQGSVRLANRYVCASVSEEAHLRQEQGDPPEGIELRVDLRMGTSHSNQYQQCMALAHIRGSQESPCVSNQAVATHMCSKLHTLFLCTKWYQSSGSRSCRSPLRRVMVARMPTLLLSCTG